MGGPEFGDAAQVADPGRSPGDEVVMLGLARLFETALKFQGCQTHVSA